MLHNMLARFGFTATELSQLLSYEDPIVKGPVFLYTFIILVYCTYNLWFLISPMSFFPEKQYLSVFWQVFLSNEPHLGLLLLELVLLYMA